jgi:hypothetical protein
LYNQWEDFKAILEDPNLAPAKLEDPVFYSWDVCSVAKVWNCNPISNCFMNDCRMIINYFN